MGETSIDIANCVCGYEVSRTDMYTLKSYKTLKITIECFECERAVSGRDEMEALKMWNSAMKGLLNA